MKEGWRERLEAACRASKRSLRSISMDAGLSEGYLFSILRDGKDPTITSLVAVAKALNISPLYLIEGYKIDRESEELLQLFASASEDQQQSLLRLVRSFLSKAP